MATYNISGTDTSLFEANGTIDAGPLQGNLLYVNPAEFGYRNADGSFSYAYGSGFTYDPAAGEFTGGTIVHVRHFDSAGRYIDDINFVTIAATDYQAALENGTLGPLLLAGDDMLIAAYLRSEPGSASLNGHGGNDAVFGSRAGDMLDGGSGDDVISGRRGGDSIIGGSGGDTLRGGFGADVMNGGTGEDTLAGGASGKDTLTGGADADVFVFNLIFGQPGGRKGSEWGHDTITDFEVGVDSIDLHTPARPGMTYANDHHGNATITLDDGNSITLIGIDARSVALDDLLI